MRQQIKFRPFRGNHPDACDNCGEVVKASDGWLVDLERPSIDSPGETWLMCRRCFSPELDEPGPDDEWDGAPTLGLAYPDEAGTVCLSVFFFILGVLSALALMAWTSPAANPDLHINSGVQKYIEGTFE